MSPDRDLRSNRPATGPTVEIMLMSRLRLVLSLSALTLVVGLALVARPADAASGEFYTWAKWRLGHAPYTCQAGASWVRPNVRLRIPASWWTRLERYRAAPCPQAPEQPTDPPAEPIAQVELDAREAALRDAVNAERSRHGLAPLPIQASLQQAARDHTADMIRHVTSAMTGTTAFPSGPGWCATRSAPPARSSPGAHRRRTLVAPCSSGSARPAIAQHFSPTAGPPWGRARTAPRGRRVRRSVLGHIRTRQRSARVSTLVVSE